MFPAAPVRFSRITVWPHLRDSQSPTILGTASAVPPARNGTKILTVRSGYSSARAAFCNGADAARNKASTTARRPANNGRCGGHSRIQQTPIGGHQAGLSDGETASVCVKIQQCDRRILPRPLLEVIMRDRPAVVIVGGGIGGLFAANALVARGVPVSVYEQAPALGKSGPGYF